MPGRHNARWVQPPHVDIQKDPSRYDEVKPYLMAAVTDSSDDGCVWSWDLLNEPRQLFARLRRGGNPGEASGTRRILLSALNAIRIPRWSIMNVTRWPPV